MQEISLILACVGRFAQLDAVLAALEPRIVPGGDALGAQRLGVIDKGLELDFTVAQHIGVGRASGAVFVQELREHAVLVFGSEVDRFELDADHIGDRCGVD